MAAAWAAQAGASAQPAGRPAVRCETSASPPLGLVGAMLCLLHTLLWPSGTRASAECAQLAAAHPLPLYLQGPVVIAVNVDYSQNE